MDGLFEADKRVNKLWKGRAQERSLEVVVVRCEPDMQAPESARRFVRVALQPDSAIGLRPMGEFQRYAGLCD